MIVYVYLTITVLVRSYPIGIAQIVQGHCLRYLSQNQIEPVQMTSRWLSPASGEKALMEAQRLQGQSPSHGNCGGLSKSSYLALPFYRIYQEIWDSDSGILVHSDVEKTY